MPEHYCMGPRRHEIQEITFKCHTERQQRPINHPMRIPKRFHLTSIIMLAIAPLGSLAQDSSVNIERCISVPPQMLQAQHIGLVASRKCTQVEENYREDTTDSSSRRVCEYYRMTIYDHLKGRTREITTDLKCFITNYYHPQIQGVTLPPSWHPPLALP